MSEDTFIESDDDETISNCKTCGSHTIWGGDHTLEDYGKEGEGIVSNYSCSNLECETTLLVEWIYGYEGDEIILHWFDCPGCFSSLLS